ncbi:MAG: ATP-binding protein [Pseudomonadota bacterium]
MNLSDYTTLLNTRVSLVGIVVSLVGIVIGLIGIMPEGFKVQWEIFLLSIVIFIFAILKKSSKPPQPSPSIINFTAQLGNKNNPGLLPKEQRLAQLNQGQNPYVCGTPLPGNSAVFYGRERELSGTLSVLGNQENPGNVSILGERRIGKSSLLNQIYQALAAEPNVVSIHTTMQNWSIDSQATFFSQLHQAISKALKIKSDSVADYAGFRDFIRDYATKRGCRFVLMIDGFEKMTNNAFFDATFFSNMRALGERHEYQFGYVLSSEAPLYDICRQGGIKESQFWNIFGRRYILGLLAKKEAEQLIQEPMRQVLGRNFWNIFVTYILGLLAKKEAENTEIILNYAGYHPAFIQIVASEYFNAPDKDAIEQTLRDYYQDLWKRRTQAERELLLKIARDEIPKNNARLTNLRQRGLVDADNKLFARFFEQFIEEQNQRDSDIV